MKIHKFYDTSSLLLKANNLFDNSEKEEIIISSITLEELEDIKTSMGKDPEVKYLARKLLHTLEEHNNEYIVHIFTEDMLEPIKKHHLSITNDTKILATALNYMETNQCFIEFITNDLCLKHIAKIFFINYIRSIEEDFEDNYSGYLEVIMDDSQMENFYSHLEENTLDALINQYIIIKNIYGEIVDRRVWTGTTYRNITFENFRSMELGDIRPMPGDAQQMFVADSLCHNKITVIRGPAGTGKS
jgi:predicted ribonuclease YlaK